MDAPSAADAVRRPPTLLLFWWSQTGQLRKAAETFVEPLLEAGWRVRRVELQPTSRYPFPWRPQEFFSVFPATVAGPPPKIALDLDPEERFDVIVLASQVWFLSPSPPVQALFAEPQARLLRDTPVITLVACRNMWYSAAAQLRSLLDRAGAEFAGSVVAIDESPAWATFVMTPRWLMTGRTDPLFGMPSPGISEPGFERLRRAGVGLARTVADGEAPALPPEAAPVDVKIALADRLGGIAFRAWARAICITPRRLGARVALQTAFVAWLAASIVTLVPIIALVRTALRRRIDPRTRAWVADALKPGTTS